jgi:acyl carrier protein
MNQDQLFRLQRIFREVFDDPSLVISPESRPADHSAWDSVAMVQILLATEQEFGVRFSMETVTNIKSVADLLRALPE